jgi:hypothetical protein
MTLPHVIDSTMLTTFRACPLHFYRSYVLKKRGQHVEAGTPASAKPSVDLVAGGAFAEGLEAYRVAFYGERLSKSDCLERAYIAAQLKWDPRLDVFPSERGDKSHLTHQKSIDRVLTAIELYFKHYIPETDDFQPKPMTREGSVAFEYSVKVPLDFPSWGIPYHPSGEPFLFGLRLDGYGTWRNLPAWLDEKTTKGIGETWAQQWPMRNQFIAYRAILREMGYDAKHCVIRGVALLKESIKFAEHVQHYPDFLADRWIKELQRDVEDMLRFYDYADWPMRIGDACTSYSGCEFRDVCLANPNAQPNLLATYGLNDWEPGAPTVTPKLITLMQGKELVL